MPNLALISHEIGEGKTSDDASKALAARQKSVVRGLDRLFNGNATMTTSELSLKSVRGADCSDGDDYPEQPRLSEEKCAVIGYLASVDGSI